VRFGFRKASDTMALEAIAAILSIPHEVTNPFESNEEMVR
jgi:hypothetical protein